MLTGIFNNQQETNLAQTSVYEVYVHIDYIILNVNKKSKHVAVILYLISVNECTIINLLSNRKHFFQAWQSISNSP